MLLTNTSVPMKGCLIARYVKSLNYSQFYTGYGEELEIVRLS